MASQFGFGLCSMSTVREALFGRGPPCPWYAQLRSDGSISGTPLSAARYDRSQGVGKTHTWR